MAGLLDALKAYIADAAPGGLLNQEQPAMLGGLLDYGKIRAQRIGALLGDSAQTGAASYSRANSPLSPEYSKKMAGLLMDLSPLGDAKSAYDGFQSAMEGDYLGAGLGALGALPMVPNLAGIMKPAAKSGFDMLDELYSSAPKIADSKASIGKLIGDIRAQSDDWANRAYKSNAKKIDVGGTVDDVPVGDFNPGQLSIGAINENKRQKRVASMAEQIESLEKFMSNDNATINTMLQDSISRVPSLRQWMGNSAEKMTDLDLASMYVNSEILGIGNIYGKTTPGYKLLQNISGGN